MLDAVEEATLRIGLGCQTVSGGGCDIIDLVDGTDRRFRVRKADVDAETGEYDIISTSDSILVLTDVEPESLIPTERWVLGYTADSDGMIADIFAARVVGITQGAVPRLRLGMVTALGVRGTPTTLSSGQGFQPADEDDLGGQFGQDEKPGGTGEADVG